MTFLRSSKKALAIAGLMSVIASQATAANGYEMRVLPFAASISVTGINDHGDVTGTLSADPVIWKADGTQVLLPNPDGPGTWASGHVINNQGQVAGTLYGQNHGALWTGGTVVDLGSYFEPSSINNAGVVVGNVQQTFRSSQGTVWQNGAATPLPNLPGGGPSGARDINDHGVIVGTGIKPGADPEATTHADLQAIVWASSGAIPTALAGPGDASIATSINNLGQIVGRTYYLTDEGFEAHSHATLWTDGVASNLGVLDGGQSSEAKAINDQGWIVGWSVTDKGFRGTLWKDGQIFDLNDRLDESWREQGWSIGSASSINESGDILVQMSRIQNQQIQHMSAVLTPVPEPEALAMCLAGLLVVASLRRRKRIA